MKVTRAADARADLLVARANQIAKHELIDCVLRNPRPNVPWRGRSGSFRSASPPAFSSTSRIPSSCAAPPARTSRILTATSTSISRWAMDRCSAATLIRLSVGRLPINSITARSVSARARPTVRWPNCSPGSDCRSGGSRTPGPRRRWMPSVWHAQSREGSASSRSKAGITDTMTRCSCPRSPRSATPAPLMRRSQWRRPAGSRGPCSTIR